MAGTPNCRGGSLGTAVVFGTSVGVMRVIFGRHFVSDIFAGIITIAIVMALYFLLLDPVRRNGARMEKLIERFAVSLHRNTAVILSGVGTALARAGSTLRHIGQTLHKQIASL